jgi:drug/metabolite transporter (DMT)-like permease
MGASAGKAGFLTAIYIILVPIISFFALKKKIGINVWLGVLIALLGLYMLCMKGSFSFTLPDIYLLLCALFFSFQILAVDHYAAGVDVFVMSTVEYLVCGVLGIIMTIIFEIVPQGMGSWTGSLSGAGAWITILYAAVFSSCLGYTFQNIGQSKVQPTLASLLFSLESVFAALAGWVLIHQKMTVREIIGCILVFAAVIVAQLRKSEETS